MDHTVILYLTFWGTSICHSAISFYIVTRNALRVPIFLHPMPKPLTVWITINCGKFRKRWEYQTTWPASWETSMQVRKQQLELDMEQGEYVKAVYCHPAYLIYMQSTSWETLGWMKHKLESGLPEKYQEPQICRWHHPYGKKWRRTKEPLDDSERGEWKSWLKAQHSEHEDHGLWSHHVMGNRWGNSGNSDWLYFSGLQNHCRWWL